MTTEMETAIDALVSEAYCVAQDLDEVPEWVRASGAEVPRSSALRRALSALRAARRPTTLLGLLPWLVLVCEDARRGTPWWMRCGEHDAVASDGKNALIVHGAARAAEHGLIPTEQRGMDAAAIAKVLGPLAEQPRVTTVRARALVDWIRMAPEVQDFAEERYLRVGAAELSPAAMRLWALPALALTSEDDEVEVRAGGAKNPAVFAAAEWTLLVMPSPRADDEERAEGIVLGGAA
jgi:hypothetical protein